MSIKHAFLRYFMTYFAFMRWISEKQIVCNTFLVDLATENIISSKIW